MRIYDTPPEAAQARTIEPEQHRNVLTPETTVTIIFRGGPPIVDMYDSRDQIIPPKPPAMDLVHYRKTFCSAEHFNIKYGLALHLQSRAIVPGTRNRHDYQKFASQIGILGVDKPEYCQPFTPEQLEKFGEGYQEGIDREGEVVEFRSVSEVLARTAAQTGVNLEDVVDQAAGVRGAPAPEGGAGVARAQQAEALAGAQGRKHSSTRAGRVQFSDAPKTTAADQETE